MAIRRIPSRLLDLFIEIMDEQFPKILDSLDSDGAISISVQQSFEIRQILTSEFCETGLDGDEPNKRGLDLEELSVGLKPATCGRV